MLVYLSMQWLHDNSTRVGKGRKGWRLKSPRDKNESTHRSGEGRGEPAFDPGSPLRLVRVYTYEGGKRNIIRARITNGKKQIIIPGKKNGSYVLYFILRRHFSYYCEAVYNMLACMHAHPSKHAHALCSKFEAPMVWYIDVRSTYSSRFQLELCTYR